MPVGKSILKLLIVSVVYAVEILRHIAVSPIVAGESGDVTIEEVAPFGCSASTPFHIEFHRRHILSRAVCLKYNIQQVRFRHRRQESNRVNVGGCECINCIPFRIKRIQTFVCIHDYAFCVLCGKSMHNFSVFMKIQIIGGIHA